MAKKFISLHEAAEILAMEPHELNRLREAGELHGFSDRGTWKFRLTDVEEMQRNRTVDSSPEVEIFDPPTDAAPQDQTQQMDLGRPSKAAGGSTEPMMDLDAAIDDFDADDDDSVLAGMSALDVAAAQQSADAGGSNVLDDDDLLSEQGTVVRSSAEDFSTSDSDVRLIVDDSVSIAGGDSRLETAGGSDSDVSLVPDSDSDVRLVDGDKAIGDDSDSDVKLVGEAEPVDSSDSVDSLDLDIPDPGSDSDVAIVDHDDLDSDSDVRVTDASDSEIRLQESDDSIMAGQTDVLASGTDSDVRLLVDEDESGIVLEFEADDEDDASVLMDDASAISLGAASGVLGAGESGISLELPSDSGVSLDVGDEGLSLSDPETDADSGIALDLGDDDSGIALDGGAADSGIALESIGDSGIALDAGSGISLADSGTGDFGGTLPMMDAAFDEGNVGQTQQFAVDGDSNFDLGDSIEMDGDATQELDSVDMDSLEDSVSDSNFEMDDAAGDLSGELSDEFDAELTGDFDDFEVDGFDDDMGVVEGDDAFDDMESGTMGGGFAPVGVRGAGPVEREWGAVEVGLLALSALVMLPLAAMMFDLMGTMWAYEAGVEPISGPVLGLFGAK